MYIYIHIEDRRIVEIVARYIDRTFSTLSHRGNYVYTDTIADTKADFRGGGRGRGEENESRNTLLLWVKRARD